VAEAPSPRPGPIGEAPAFERLQIDSLGARGDGVAPTAAGVVHVSYALPGETVLVKREGARAQLVSVENPAPERAEPFCPHFGACGGCLTQHMRQEAYAAWKRGVLTSALQRAKIDAPVDSLVDAHGAGRRRVTFHARYRDGAARVGYMAARSHDLVEIDACPVAEPALQASPRAALILAAVLRRAGKPLDIQITATQAGLDIDVRGHGPVDSLLRGALVAAADRLDLARLSLHGDVVVERRPLMISMGRAAVRPPPGGFLQATQAGEERLAAIVVEACGDARRIADLFAGCGPFALRLAERREVHAVDGDAASLAALDAAARRTAGLRRVTVEHRDLFRRPLLGPELDRFDAVVMDPPRAGAEAQARRLARSKAALVVSVSCDVATFIRDARILIDGGYRAERIAPVDQFKHTPHLELVGVFRRAASLRA
jgi:23S rRNA (uracil1939-C5)-methyltransferase